MPLLFTIVGLLVGGLMNALADRLPPLDPEYDGPFIAARPRRLRRWEYLPVASFVSALRSPRMMIRNHTWRYPLTEAAIAGASLLAYYRFDDPAVAVGAAIFAALLITLAVIDLETQYLPHRLVYPTAIAALAFAPFWPDLAWWEPLVAAAVGFGFFYPIYWIGMRLDRPLMGGGDAYLAAALGAILGLKMLLLGLYIGILAGGLVAIFIYAARLLGHKQQVMAYGPYLAFGGLVAMYYGASIIDWVDGRVV